MAGSATISTCFSLIAINGIGGKEQVSMTFTSSKIMEAGCTLGAVIVDTTDNSGGATLSLLKNGATTMLAGAVSTAPATAGTAVLPLSPTAADLALAPANTMVLATQGATSANRIELVMCQPSPRTVPVT